MDRDATAIESEKDRLGLDAFDGEAAKVRCSSHFVCITDGGDASHFGRRSFEHRNLLAGRCRLGSHCPWLVEHARSDSEANDGQHRFKTTSPCSLLSTSEQERRKDMATPHDDGC